MTEEVFVKSTENNPRDVVRKIPWFAFLIVGLLLNRLFLGLFAVIGTILVLLGSYILVKKYVTSNVLQVTLAMVLMAIIIGTVVLIFPNAQGY